MNDDDRVTALQTLTAHRFADRAAALAALTHRSFANEHPGAPDYEVLEFLGDAVLQLAVTDLLVRRAADRGEGVLTRHRQHLVRGTALAEVGREVGLPALLRLGRGEAAKPSVEDSIVEAAVEAVLGAVYHDGGFDAAFPLVRRWIEPRLYAAVDGERPEYRDRPAPNQLQEWMHQQGLGDPRFEPAEERNPDETWSATVIVGDRLFDGVGGTKKAAVDAAARVALAALRRDPGE